MTKNINDGFIDKESENIFKIMKLKHMKKRYQNCITIKKTQLLIRLKCIPGEIFVGQEAECLIMVDNSLLRRPKIGWISFSERILLKQRSETIFAMYFKHDCIPQGKE